MTDKIQNFQTLRHNKRKKTGPGHLAFLQTGKPLAKTSCFVRNRGVGLLDRNAET